MLDVFVITIFASLCPIKGDAKCVPFVASLVRQEAEWTNHECQQWADTLVDVAAKENGKHFVPEKCVFTNGIYIK